MTNVLHARIALQGVTPLYDRSRLATVLDRLAENGYPPTKAGLEERRRKAYDRDAILALLYESPRPMEQTSVHLTGKGFEGALGLGENAVIGIDFKPPPPREQWSRIFTLADALADVFEPDWGACGMFLDARADIKADFANDDERDLYLVGSGIGLYPKDYLLRGPHGLGPRTYIGAFFADQLGRERIETLPLVVEKRAWGYRVDLVAEPWAADAAALVAAWRRGMEHLREVGMFPTPEIAHGYAMRWTRGPNFKSR